MTSTYKLTSPIDVYSASSNAQINLSSSGSAFAVQIKAPTTLTTNVDFTLPSSSGSIGQYLQRTGISSLGWTTTLNPSGSLPNSMRTYRTSTATCTNSTSTYRRTLVFPFLGSTALGGSPTAAYIIISHSNNTVTSKVQLLDSTNSTTIATATSGTFTAGTLNLLSLGTITNIPATPAIFTLNFARNSGGGTVSIYNFKFLM